MELWEWILKECSITYPNRKYWSASVTLGGMDVNGEGQSIQKAMENLRDKIEASKHLMKSFANL